MAFETHEVFQDQTFILFAPLSGPCYRRLMKLKKLPGKTLPRKEGDNIYVPVWNLCSNPKSLFIEARDSPHTVVSCHHNDW